MDDRQTYLNKKPTRSGSPAPSRDHLTSTYTELSIRKIEPLVNAQTDGLDCAYSQLNYRPSELLIAKDEDRPIASGPGEKPVIAQADPHKQEPNENVTKRPNCKICLLCLVTFGLGATVVGLSIHVPQIRQSKETWHRNYHELNSTLQSKLSALNSNLSDLNRMHSDLRQQFTEMETKYRSINETRACNQLNSTIQSMISENSHLDLSQRTCLKNLSALNSDLSYLKRMHNDLRQQFTEMEKKYRSVNDTKGQICELLTSRREQVCPRDWIRNEDRCYFISTLKTSYDGAKRYCSNIDARLLEINSKAEQNAVANTLVPQYRIYWIGKCEDGREGSGVMVKDFTGMNVCGNCDWDGWGRYCNGQNYFICEKPTHWCTEIPEEIQDLCQQSPEPN